MSEKINILGVDIDCVNMSFSVQKILNKVNISSGNYICVTGAHGIVESLDDLILRESYKNSFLNVPDGMPCVWIGKMHKKNDIGRVYGPELMMNVIKESEKIGLKHFFYGANEKTLQKLKNNILKKYPNLNIVGTFAPPFRELNEEEEMSLRNLISKVSPDFMWIGLSCPKQEKFMLKHSFKKKYSLDVKMMIGVGAAFDYHAENIKDSPEWIKKSGLQWLHRLMIEPKRLWKRYFKVIPLFLILTFLQKINLKKF